MRRVITQLSTFTMFIIYYCTVSFASDFHSPRTEALGGAGHASPLLSDALYLNPSFTSFTQTHAFSLNYLLFSGPPITTANGPTDYYGNNLNMSVIDGTSESLFQAGVGYTRRDDATLIHVGASKSIIQRFGVGIGAKFVFPKNSVYTRFTDANLSFTALVSSWFQSSIIVDNLFESANPALNFKREFILGTKFNVNPFFLLYLDPHFTPTLSQDKFGYQAGVELPFFKDFFVRLGLFKNSMVPFQAIRGNGFGFGGGWIAPKLSLDYAFSHVLSPQAATVHNFGFTVYF